MAKGTGDTAAGFVYHYAEVDHVRRRAAKLGKRGIAGIEEIEREISGVLARHASETSMNAALFARIDAVYQAAGLRLRGT